MTTQAQENFFVKFWHDNNKSKYAVERCFNQLSIKHKQIIIALASISPTDLTEPTLSGYKLAHYTHKGISKIVQAVKTIRCISKEFPEVLSARQFYQIDREVNNE